MKKLFFACSLLFCCMTATAGSLYFGPTLFMQQTTSNDDNFRGLHPRLSVGYQDIFSYFYLAGELYIVPFTGSLYESNTTRSESVRTEQEYGVSLLPGLYVSENIITYLRLGLVATKFYGPDTTKGGTEFGVGLQSQLSDNWSLRFEYVYYAYPSMTGIGSPTTDQYGVGLIYRLQ